MEELVKGLSALQVVEERMDRYTCTAKNGYPSRDLRVAVDDGV